jgi:hypothetical protein
MKAKKSKSATPSTKDTLTGLASRVAVARPFTAKPVTSGPVFAEPIPAPDPKKYKVPHASDAAAYKELDDLIKNSQFLPIGFPPMTSDAEPVLTLATALGSSGKSTTDAITKAGQIVFHAAGDTGATRGPKTEISVVAKMLADFEDEASHAVPQFFYNLGDVVYSFGEHKYYYDQFYEAYRNYPRPIFAIPGNHDGIVLPPPAGPGTPTLSAFKENFCNSAFVHGTDAMGLSRTTMIQPEVFFTLEAPFIRILGLYSNVLENPGVISTQSGRFPDVTDRQLDYLKAALSRVKKEGFAGALLFAVHHPPYASGLHSGSIAMLKEIDAICNSAGVWPHAVISGHAHNYQRYTRALNGRQIPYLIVGNGGHAVNPLTKGAAIRTPVEMPVFEQPEAKDTVTFESYDDKNYGYLRVIADAKQLRIEYHPASDGTTTKTPDDAVTVELTSGALVHYNLLA